MSSENIVELGKFLTASEAEALAVQFESGLPSFKALEVINSARREEAKRLLLDAEHSGFDGGRMADLLLVIAGAKSLERELTPVWTMPGNEASLGHLTGEFHRLVQSARQSIVCATYNFEKTSQMWEVLRVASEEPGVAVIVYVDGDKADAAKVKAQLPNATIYRSAELPNGRPIVSHAKFVVIDHELLLLTSANFSYSAENRNIEFGLLVHDSALAESVESTMRSKHGVLYELES